MDASSPRESEPERDETRGSRDETEPEFIDEPPGAFLGELRVGRWIVVWAAANAIAAAGLVAGWALGGSRPESAWWVLLKLAWTLLPPSCLLLFLVSGWVALVGAPDQPRRRMASALLVSALALAARLALSLAPGVDFTAPEP